MSERGLEPVGDHWRLPCEGLIVGQVRIDYAFGLELTETLERAADVAWRLRVEVPFSLRTAEGEVRELDPQEQRALLGPALDVFHQQLVEGGVWNTGRLELTFANGISITVDPHPQYEAWQLYPDSSDGLDFALISPLVPDTVNWG